ncbi:MAG: methylmalonyl-CoA epimerase [Candidatus Neomarinimicrobiota bacterium]|nr:MAG: methylmalonyl-CoA epimerase [bacterium]
MKILGIEHIGIAVEDTENRSPFWEHVLGINRTTTEIVEHEGVKTDIYNTGKGKVELLKSISDDSTIEKFLNKKGEGIHHVCFEVDNIKQAIIELKEKNISIVSENPSIGAEGYKIVFIHPKSTGGVLVELAEKTT